MSNWVTYTNGNYHVMLNTKTGTKIRKNDQDFFEATFPESIDYKICNRCNMGCSMCHENSTPDGKLGDIMNVAFIESLHPYTELAIGGGNPLEHPELELFLKKCKELKLIPSMTVHQNHFIENIDFIRKLRDEELIYGLGVSVNNPTDELVSMLKEFPNIVVHLINGMSDKDVFEKLKDNNLKCLILGYKVFRRGADLYNHQAAARELIDLNKSWLYDTLPTIIEEEWFNTVSFDNLAITQLNVRRLMTSEEWNEFYMGDDGTMTMYIDGVKNEFAISSVSPTRFSLLDNIEDMFTVVKQKAKEKKLNDALNIHKQ